jgi:hypothetical protein
MSAAAAPPIELKMHDLFNITALSIITLLSLSYLIQATEYSNLGTAQIGSEYYDSGAFLHRVFAVYVLFDSIWITLLPQSVPGSPWGIVAHHIVCLFLISIPLVVPQFLWHGAVSMSVEINTVFLTLRRNVLLNSPAYHISNCLFYATWALLRLILFPLLAVFFYFEYVRYSGECGTYQNVLAFSFLLQGLIAAMGYKWTYEMLCKQRDRKDQRDQRAKDV